MRAIAIAFLIVLSLIGAGCGGDNTASDGTVATETTEGITAEESTDETTTDEGDPGAFADEDCASLIAASSQLSQAFAAAGDIDGDVEESRELFDQFAADAPEEIRADLEVLAAAYSKYADAIGDIDLEPGQVPDAEAIAQLQAAIASIDQTEVTEASANVSAWTSENC